MKHLLKRALFAATMALATVSASSWAYENEIAFMGTIADGGQDSVGQTVDGLNGISEIAISNADYVYAAGLVDDAVAVFKIDRTTGSLQAKQVLKNGVSGVTGLDGACCVALSPDGTQLYAASLYSRAFVVFNIGSNGLLTQVQRLAQGEIDASGRTVTGMSRLFNSGNTDILVSSDGKFVYVANQYAGGAIFEKRVSDGIWISKDTGQNTGMVGVVDATLSLNSQNLYTNNTVDDAVYHYSRNAETGLLTYVTKFSNGSTYPNLANPRSVAINVEQNLAVAASASNALVTFSRNTSTGALGYLTSVVNGGTDAAGNTIADLNLPFKVAFNHVGNRLMTVNNESDSVGLFSLSANQAILFKGSLKNGETLGGNALQGVDAPGTIAFSGDDRYFVVGSYNSDALHLFRDDGAHPPTITSFSANRTSVVEGTPVQLNWNVNNADSVTIEQNIGTVALSGSMEVFPTQTTSYVVTAQRGLLQATQAILISVTPLVGAAITATPSQVYAPGSVRFRPIISTSSAVDRYYWDFQGDGGTVSGSVCGETRGFDYVDSIKYSYDVPYDVTGRDYDYTFQKAGTYQPRLCVVSTEGVSQVIDYATTSTTVQVMNAAPVVNLSVDKVNGAVPLTVNFTVSATDHEGIAEEDGYHWDFDGNGSVDATTSTGSVSHTYNSEGLFQTRLEVFDVGVPEANIPAASRVVASPDIQIQALPEGSASVALSASTTSGVVPLATTFTATPTVPVGATITGYQWDFEGNGTFVAGSASEGHTYPAAGIYYPAVRLTTDTAGAPVQAIQLQVSSDYALSILNTAGQRNTIDPTDGEQAAIRTVSSGDSEIELVIEDYNGNQVRTLVNWTARVAGEYIDAWDGRDGAGNILPHGAYFAVLRTKDNAQSISELDLRNTTGGKRFYPDGWGGSGTSCNTTYNQISPCGVLTIPTGPLQPYANLYWNFKFTSPHIAMFHSYMTDYQTNAIVSQFFQARLFGSNDLANVNDKETIQWLGEATDQTLLPKSSTKYLITVLGYTLADNAIFLDHGPRLSNPVKSTAAINPAADNNLSESKLIFSFNLDRDAEIEYWITDVETGWEMYRTSTSLQAGSGVSVTWNGNTNSGVLVGEGDYMISAVAKAAGSYQSLPVRAIVQVRY